MNSFMRGQVYMVDLPETLYTEKITPTSPIPVGTRPVFILHGSNDLNFSKQQVLIAPIFSNSEILNSPIKLLVTHIPLSKQNYPFLLEDSYVSTHQVIPINRHWLKSNMLGFINISIDLYNIDLGLISAKGLNKTLKQLVRVEAEKLQLEFIDNSLHYPSSNTNSHFTRGDVFYADLPKIDANPHYTLYGHRMVIVLHDSSNKNYDDSQVLIVPISKAESTIKNDDLLPTHIPLQDGEYTFIKTDCFICAHKIMPISREWLDNKKGTLSQQHMFELDFGLIIASNLLETIQSYIKVEIEKLREMALKDIL